MDDLDRRLVALLRRDARAPLSGLAAALGVARSTVRARLERLVARGDLLGFTVTLREDAAPAPVRGLMMLEVEGRGAERLIHRLTGWPEVAAVHTTHGRWDLVVEVGTDTLEALDRVLTEVRRLDGVRTSETTLLLSTRTPRR